MATQAVKTLSEGSNPIIQTIYNIITILFNLIFTLKRLPE